MVKLRTRTVSKAPKPPDRPVIDETVTPVHSPAGAHRHANRQSLINKRERLLRRKTVPRRELLRTLDLLNEAQVINALPNEILVYVLELSQPTTDALDGNWLGRLYLCRRWYHLITSMPRFWRDVHVSSHPEWLELCLSRCGGTPVDVYFTGRFSLLATVPTFTNHGQLIGGITYTILRPSWVSDIDQLLSMPLPSLQTLDISLSTRSLRRAEIDSNPENIMHLRTLKLRSCRVPHDPAVYSSLSNLDIGPNCSWKMNFEHFLQALGTTKNLCELVLSDCFANWYNIPQGLARTNPPRQSPIALSRLRVLKLTGMSGALTSHFLARILVPNAHHIDIRLKHRSSRTISDVFPVHAAAFSSTCSLATSLEMDRQCVVAKTEDRYLCVHSRGLGDMSNINGLLHAFGEAPLRQICLCWTSGTSTSDWERLLRSYPTLREVHAPLHEAFFSALETVSQPAGEVCCPELATLTSSDCCPVSETTYAVILSALRARAARGARLKKLVLRLSEHLKGEESSQPEQFEAELKTLVEDLDYRHIDSAYYWRYW